MCVCVRFLWSCSRNHSSPQHFHLITDCWSLWLISCPSKTRDMTHTHLDSSLTHTHTPDPAEQDHLKRTGSERSFKIKTLLHVDRRVCRDDTVIWPGLKRTMALKHPSSVLSICMSLILDTSSVRTLRVWGRKKNHSYSLMSSTFKKYKSIFWTKELQVPVKPEEFKWIWKSRSRGRRTEIGLKCAAALIYLKAQTRVELDQWKSLQGSAV